MKTKVTPKTLATLMAHVRRITPTGVEVRDVCCDPIYGVGFTLDSFAGEASYDLVRFSCTPTSEEEGEVPGGWHIYANRQKDGLFVGAWVAQGESLESDYYAAWLAVMATRSGNTYWLEPLEIIEGE
jgi:hypothetical protein